MEEQQQMEEAPSAEQRAWTAEAIHFHRHELKPLRVQADVLEAVDIVLQMAIWLEEQTEPGTVHLERIEHWLTEQTFSVAKAGQGALGSLRIRKDGDGCSLALQWMADRDTWNLARGIHRALSNAFDTHGLLPSADMGRPKLTTQEWRERAGKVATVEARREKYNLTWEAACAQCGVPFSSFKRWRSKLAQQSSSSPS
jgi:hypothetical protein